MKKTDIHITRQGRVIIDPDGAYVFERTKNMVAVMIYTTTKNPSAGTSSGTDGNGFFFIATDNSVKTHETEIGATEFFLPEFKEWHPFAVDAGRYTTYICLTRRMP